MRNALKISSALVTTPIFLFLAANIVMAGWNCCDPSNCDPNGPYPCATNPTCSTCQSTETKNPGSCPSGDAACKALECPVGKVSSQCDLGGGGGPSSASCTQAIYAVPIPANMTIGQILNFYADGHQDVGNFVKMTASITNVPTSTPAIATVATTSGPTCYANGNCRQGFRLTAKANGTALLRVTTQMKLCPACAVSGSCTGTRTINVGSVTPLMCKPGAACTSNTGTYSVGSRVTCNMPALSTTELNGGIASYQLQCTPYKGTTAQAVLAKSSVNGAFPYITIATGVTSVNCSFRYCVTGTNGVTQCSLWGTK